MRQLSSRQPVGSKQPIGSKVTATHLFCSGGSVYEDKYFSRNGEPSRIVLVIKRSDGWLV